MGKKLLEDELLEVIVAEIVVVAVAETIAETVDGTNVDNLSPAERFIVVVTDVERLVKGAAVDNIATLLLFLVLLLLSTKLVDDIVPEELFNPSSCIDDEDEFNELQSILTTELLLFVVEIVTVVLAVLAIIFADGTNGGKELPAPIP